MFYLLSPLPQLEFFYIPVLETTVFFFYYFELINNAWWLWFIMHLKACKPNRLDENIRKWTIWKETLLAVIIGTLMIGTVIVLLGIFVQGFVYKWWHCKIYPIDNNTQSESWDEDKCIPIFNFSENLYTFMFSIGIFSAVSKVFIGIYMMSLMKRKLHFPYLSVKNKVILTMISTWLLMGFNVFVNLF